jgi:hypothetical protein
MTTMNLALYPASADEVTADRLAASLAVSAQRRYLATIDAPELDRTAMNLFVKEWGVIYLLRETQERMGVDAADRLARDLWQAWEGGELGEYLHEWLTEYGIDPKTVAQ